MMDEKEKQIEEMAKVLCGRKLCGKKFNDCVSVGECKQSKELAENVFKQGYRKIPEGAVVLTREEFDEFRKDQAEVKFLKNQLQDQARKETAREFVKALKKKLYTNNYCQEIVTEEYIDEVAKQYGVEVDDEKI